MRHRTAQRPAKTLAPMTGKCGIARRAITPTYATRQTRARGCSTSDSSCQCHDATPHRVSLTRTPPARDNRYDYYDAADPHLKAAARSTLIMASRFDLTLNPPSDVTTSNAAAGMDSVDRDDLLGDTYRHRGAEQRWTSIPSSAAADAPQLQLCPSVAFYGQPQMGACSGFLIDTDVIVASGHCFDADACRQGWAAWIFDWRLDAPPRRVWNAAAARWDTVWPQGFDPLRIPKRNVYYCREVIDRQTTAPGTAAFIDHTIIRLDRHVYGYPTGRVLPRIQTAPVAQGDAIVAIGSPHGLPVKFAPGNVRSRDIRRPDGGHVDHRHQFLMDADTYGGNSGSLVLNAKTYEVVGMVALVHQGYVSSNANDASACMVAYTCDAVLGCGAGFFNTAASVLNLLPYLPHLVSGNPRPAVTNVWTPSVDAMTPALDGTAQFPAAIATPAYMAASTRSEATRWQRYALISRLQVEPHHFRDGYQSQWIADTIRPCSDFRGSDQPDGAVVLRVVLGAYVDYFKVVAQPRDGGGSLCAALTEPGQWYYHSYTGKDGPWRAVNGNHSALLGGFFPYARSDRRVWGPFWGAPAGERGYHAEGGACCDSGDGTIAFWQTLTMDVLSPPRTTTATQPGDADRQQDGSGTTCTMPSPPPLTLTPVQPTTVAAGPCQANRQRADARRTARRERLAVDPALLVDWRDLLETGSDVNTFRGPWYQPAGPLLDYPGLQMQLRNAAQFDAVGVASGTTVFIGDSITENFLFADKGGDAWAHLQRAGVHPVNFGVGGDSVQNILLRYNMFAGHHRFPAGNTLPLMQQVRPKLFVLMMGTNNYDLLASQMADAVLNFVDVLHHDFPCAAVLVSGITPNDKPGRNARLQTANQLLRTEIDSRLGAGAGAPSADTCKCHGHTEFIESWQAFFTTDGDASPGANHSTSGVDLSLYIDDLHLNRAGYERWMSSGGSGLHDRVVAMYARCTFAPPTA